MDISTIFPHVSSQWSFFPWDIHRTFPEAAGFDPKEVREALAEAHLGG